MRLIYGNGLHDLALRGRAAPAAPAWRPGDPNTLAWARADGTVLVENAYTGLVVWRHRGGIPRTLAWSPDGRRLLIAGRRHGAIHSLTGGSTRLTLHPGETLTAAAFAPSGRRLALATRSDGVSAIRLDGARASLVESTRPIRSLAWSPDARWVLGDRLLARVGSSPAVQALAAGTTALSWAY
jgi:WD40 repeat protein